MICRVVRFNYSVQTTDITSAFFGLIRSAAAPRTMQIGARRTL